MEKEKIESFKNSKKVSTFAKSKIGNKNRKQQEHWVSQSPS